MKMEECTYKKIIKKKYIVKNEDDYKKTSYYYEENKQPVELNTVPLVAKVALKKEYSINI